jgi:hypothetical protein
MDQDETTGETPTEAVAQDEPARGKVLQTFLVRVTVRANEDGTEGTIPTNEHIAQVIEVALYEDLDDVDRDSINASAEKV